MNSLRSSMGFLVDLAGSATWALAGFFIVARLFSTSAGAVVALAIFTSAVALMLMTRMQESRASSLLRGACPDCGASLKQSHSHRRWDAARERWLAPLTTWECSTCGYGHEEPAPCEKCPDGA